MDRLLSWDALTTLSANPPAGAAITKYEVNMTSPGGGWFHGKSDTVSASGWPRTVGLVWK